MKTAFRRISRVRNLGGFTRWYLSEDCLLAAKQVMYAVEYRRFYLRDLEAIVIWPNRLWLMRLLIPGALLAALGAALWAWVDTTTGVIFGCLALGWLVLELALGPTAKSRIRSTGGTVDIVLVARTRRAGKVLSKIDAAVRAHRGEPTDPGVISQPAESSAETMAERSGTGSIAVAAETHAS